MPEPFLRHKSEHCHFKHTFWSIPTMFPASMKSISSMLSTETTSSSYPLMTRTHKNYTMASLSSASSVDLFARFNSISNIIFLGLSPITITSTTPSTIIHPVPFAARNYLDCINIKCDITCPHICYYAPKVKQKPENIPQLIIQCFSKSDNPCPDDNIWTIPKSDYAALQGSRTHYVHQYGILKFFDITEFTKVPSPWRCYYGVDMESRRICCCVIVESSEENNKNSNGVWDFIRSYFTCKMSSD